MKRSLGCFFRFNGNLIFLIQVLTAALPNKGPSSNVSVGNISQMSEYMLVVQMVGIEVH